MFSSGTIFQGVGDIYDEAEYINLTVNFIISCKTLKIQGFKFNDPHVNELIVNCSKGDVTKTHSLE